MTRQRSLVVVPVTVITRLTRDGLSAALSLGDEVLAATVVHESADAEALRRDWELWQPGMPLLEIPEDHRRRGCDPTALVGPTHLRSRPDHDGLGPVKRASRSRQRPAFTRMEGVRGP
ncbi:hypothetical protein ACWC9T_25355 [Kitasatospora sp. NPDC001159]